MDVHRYERLKSELADILRSVPWRSEQFERNRDIYARLAEDRFNLAVVGRFSRGKSTLMNAMLGLDRLPTGVEPLTSVITSVTYGSHERVVLHFEHTSLFQDIRIDELDDYITERGNPGNRRRVLEAEIQLPADLLRSGFRFIDTPGLGSTVAGNTATTRAFLPEADAFVLVTGFDGALTDDEAAILHMARRAGKQLFIAVNKSDLIGGEQRTAHMEEMRHRLSEIGFDDGAPRLYPVSAIKALQARTGSLSSSNLDGSGLPELESDIIAFLTSGKRIAFLRGMCARLQDILAAEPALVQPRGRLAELQKQIGALSSNEAHAAPRNVSEAALGANIPECDACASAEAAVFDALATLQVDLGRSEASRREFAQMGGLCGAHSRAFMKHAAPREVCIGFAPVLDVCAQQLRCSAADIEIDQIHLVARHATPTCILCQVARDSAARALSAFADMIETLDQGPVPQKGFCLPHLDILAARLASNRLLPDLLRMQARILERRSDDMRRFALKRDASMNDRISDEEKVAGRRGVNALVGQADTSEASPP